MGEEQRFHAMVQYQKTGLLRYLGHLDLAKAFDRAVRRARIPVKYTQGYSPRAQISFPPPLPVGVEGLAELCAVELQEAAEARDIYVALAPELRSFRIAEVEVRRRARRSLWTELKAAGYQAVPDFAEDVDEAVMQQAVAQLLGADEIAVERKTKRRTRCVNIRPHIYRLRAAGDMIDMVLGVTEETLVKPDEVLTALARAMGAQEDGGWRRLVRTGLHFGAAQ